MTASRQANLSGAKKDHLFSSTTVRQPNYHPIKNRIQAFRSMSIRAACCVIGWLGA
jgi:hypothetical protein